MLHCYIEVSISSLFYVENMKVKLMHIQVIATKCIYTRISKTAGFPEPPETPQKTNNQNNQNKQTKQNTATNKQIIQNKV